MTTTINADTSTGGAVISGDASGVLGLQAAGSTQVTINGSGVVLANPLPVGSGGTGATSLSGITAGSATNLAGGSAGTVPYQSASGTTAMLAAGTSGQVLTSSGAGAPTWTTPSAGALTLVSSVTATNGASTIDLTSGFTSTYDVYMLVGSGLVCSANQGSVDVTVNIGGSWLSTGYGYYASALSSNLGDFGGNSNNGSRFIMSTDWGGGDPSGTLDFVMYIYNPASTSLWKNFSWEGTVISYSAGSNYPVSFRGGGAQKNTSALTGVRITPGSRTMVSGVMRLYGISKS